MRFIVQSACDVTVTGLMPIDIFLITVELPVPALQGVESHAEQQAQDGCATTIDTIFVEDFQGFPAVVGQPQVSLPSMGRPVSF